MSRLYGSLSVKSSCPDGSCVLLGLVWLLLAQAVLIRTDSHRGEESLCGGGPEGEGAGPQLGHRH